MSDVNRNALPLGRIYGIGIFVHYSWLFIAALIVLSFWGQLEVAHESLDSAAALALATLGATLFFLSVLVHELAHAVVAVRRGFDVEGITLYLFGGVTETDASSRTAGDEFVIAIVGPLTSLAIAAAFGAVAIAGGGGDEPVPWLLGYLAFTNLLLAGFNMAPGLPLDGGRVFRSIVWRITGDFTRATRWATNGGIAVGYILISVGMLALWSGSYGGLWLMAIGWVISQSAKQNETQERLRSEFRDLVAADIMSSPVIAIPADASVAIAVRDYFARRSSTSFPVVEDGQIRGMISVAAVREIPPTEIWNTTVGQLALRGDPPLIVHRRTPMAEVISGLESRREGSLRALVVEDGHLVGIISPSDILRRHSISELIEPALAETVSRRQPPV